jgi:DNA-binding GntR family transcriptional regulator
VLKLAAKPDLVAQTHAAIRAAIVSGEFAPCAPLAQEELAATLGVSRQPISHALALLKREGLVVDRGRKGQMVAPIDAEKLLGLYQVRGALDRLAARLTVANAQDGSTDLMRMVDDSTAAIASGDINAVAALDIAFHQKLHHLSGNAEIARTADTFWPHMARSMRTVLAEQDRWETIWAEHGAIADAIARGDAHIAGELAAAHAETAGKATYLRLTDDKNQ